MKLNLDIRKLRSPWKRLWFFPWIEVRKEFEQLWCHGKSVGVMISEISARRWRWYQEPEPPQPKPISVPGRLLFDWKRDYGPLWEPGSRAFWLEPEPGDLPAGEWPLPHVKQRPGVIQQGDVIFYEDDLTHLTPRVYVTRYGT